MPSRNIVKQHAPESYYHAYARGSSRQPIFLDASDYRYFIYLFNRYLSKEKFISKTGVPYPSYRESIDLLSFCLMRNHFHMLLYQKDDGAMSSFMKSVLSSYTRYFNLKYKRTGAIFESTYKAVRIDDDSYLQHITRYIHLNPRYWEKYKYSSLKYYRDGSEPEWLKNGKILCLFPSRSEYMKFVGDYEEMRDMLTVIKYSLADK